MKKGMKIILVLVLIPVVLLTAFFILLSVPKTVGVEYSDSDLQSYLEKTGVNFHDNNASIEDIFFKKYTTSGSKEVEGTLTSAEASALANAVINETSVLKNIRIKFVGEDRVQASATIGSNLSLAYELFPTANQYKTVIDTVKGKTVYIETSLIHQENNSFFAMLSSVSVGQIPFPVDQANFYGTEIGTILNDVLETMPGFNVETFKIDADGLHFKGAIPEETQSLSD
jgi:hypothetical protein